MSTTERQRLYENTARAMNGANEEVMGRHVFNCSLANAVVVEALGFSMQRRAST
jgi:hypothetical protein